MVERVIAGSVLALDWGSTRTKAFLLDRVDGNYRLIATGWAPTFGRALEYDPIQGLQEAVSRIEKAIGRRLIGSEGLPLIPEREMEGVDFFTASVSFPSPLKVMLVSLSKISLEAARKAISSYYTVEAGSFSFLEEESRSARVERLLRTLSESMPDLILITGGTEGSNPEPIVEMARMLSLVYPLYPGLGKPPIIFAGNTAARGAIEEILSPITQLRFVDNVLPSLDEQNIGPLFKELEELYRQIKLSELYNLGYLRSTLSAPLTSSLSAFILIIRYLCSLYGFERGVLGVDVGGTYTTMVGATKDNFLSTVRCDLALNRADFLLREPERVARWLPYEANPEKIAEIVLEKSLRPETVPLTKEELMLEGAIIREVMREAFSTAREAFKSLFGPELSVDMVVVTGGALGSFPMMGWVTLMLLDALQLSGVMMLAVDKLGLCSALGSLAPLNPVAVSQVLERDALAPLGTIIAPLGSAPEGTIAIKATISFDDGRVLEAEVKAGSIEVIPLAPGRKAILEISFPKGMSLEPGGKKRQAKIEARGGLIGIVFDARGRPLPLPYLEQKDKIQKWLWEMET